VAAAIKLTRPDVAVIGVEPSGAAAMKASLDAGHAVTLDRTDSIADGLLPVRPGDLTLAHVRRFVDRVITVEDDQIVDAVLWLSQHAGMTVEPSGAATVAAALAGAAGSDGPIVAIVSGGNMSMDTLAELRRTRA
jgi:threonine dehydratase